MKNLYFDDFEEFACAIADKFDELDTENFEDIAVIAKPNEIKEIFKELICIGYDICNITYERIDWDGYDDEYVLSMNHEGIWLEKFKRENGYFEDESTIIYILDNCSSKVIPYCKGSIVFEVSVGDDECEDTEESYSINGKPTTKEEFDAYVEKIKKNDSKCDKCVEYSKDDDGDIHGFTASKSDGDGYVCYSFYTSENLMKNDIEDILKLF